MIRGLWERETIALLILAAALPVGIAGAVEGGWAFATTFTLALAVLAFWQGVFLFARAQLATGIGVLTALAVTLLGPQGLAPWQIILGVSFGAVIGEQVFGGWGRNIINTAVASLAFLFFAFPEAVTPEPGWLIAVSSVPGAALLVVLGVLAWPIPVGAIMGIATVGLLMGADLSVLFSHGAIVFGIVFLSGDPVTSSATPAGRWAYGGLAGGLAGLLGWAAYGVGAPQTIVFATLLASLFAPLIDHTVITISAAARKRRHG
ncbi:RnfABCDGE type electron transport complex subunit D [Pelagibacterium xiamenense]|uniref:RnfABCDGE type electron transport complex subunit D n=1 Tax=Pelagibacterium xiamenense TaxID=2901140 RepID=UPI001E3D653E|nr:RnfABCDGE type electron transport complex subunit D [Pelagibacterium xiamenense]MCD7059362.1 RnfABCDGE type electron transport complex subunit D [Pelagibacterium xiamenense]